MNLQNIKTVARIESKTLRRNPVLSGIAILGLIAIFVLQYFQQSKQFTTFWYMIALPSCLPFINALLFSYLQSIFIVLAVCEWRRNANRTETLHALRTRPVNNSEYLLGKSLGILATVFTLALVSIAASLAIHLFNSDAPFHPLPYIFYLFSFTIPSAIFLTGIATALSAWLKKSGITLLLLLVLFLFSWYYLPPVLHGLLDHQATRLPNLFSDITGHVALAPYLLHRLVFLFTGIAAGLLAMGLEKRLPHHVHDNTRSRLAGTSILFIALLAATTYLYHFMEIDNVRENYRATLLKHESIPSLHVKEHQITVKQEKDQLLARSLLKIENPTPAPVEEILLYLNPGLKITRAENHLGQPVAYQREHQAIRLKYPLSPGDTTTLTLEYQGSIDERVCYLDINDPEYHDDQLYASPLHPGKRYAYVSDRYTLLTPESIWYPATHPTVNLKSPYLTGKDFTRFRLNVIAHQHKTVISQGRPRQTGDTTRFDIGHPLPALSLCIGDYKRRSITIDSVLMELYTFKDHFHLTWLFDKMTTEQLHASLREQKEYFENHYKFRYPFNKFVLMETPLSFASHHRPWANTHEHVQPEIVMFPEKWITLRPAAPQYIRKLIATHKQSSSMLGIQDYNSDGDIYLKMNFTRYAFLDNSTPFTRRHFIIHFQASNKTKYATNKQNISGLFNAFTNHWQSDRYPIINKIILKFESQSNLQEAFFNASSQWFIAHEYLTTHSLKEAMNDSKLPNNTFDHILRIKTQDLLNHITLKTSNKDFLHFIRSYKNRHPFQVLSFDSFIEEVKQTYDINLVNILPAWFESTRMPRYIIKDIEIYQIENENQYIVHTQIRNDSDTDGIISLTITGKHPATYYSIPANTCWIIKEKTPVKPHTVLIHTHLSMNIPYIIQYSHNTTVNTTRDTATGIFQLSPQIFLPNPNEIIVDNEDPGFQIIIPNKRKKLDYFTHKTPLPLFINISTEQFPKNISSNHWIKSINNSYYGYPIKSIMCKKAGKGDYMASWTTHLPKMGHYEIFIYSLYFRTRLENPYEQHYTIKTKNMEENISIKTSKEYPDEQWVSIGTYYLNAEEITIILNDKGSHPNQIISADAVKYKFIKE